jgi:hypothetical protein
MLINNSANTDASEKISAYLESLEIKKFCDECLTKFKNNKVLLNEISH